jgi:hypothetical protein
MAVATQMPPVLLRRLTHYQPGLTSRARQTWSEAPRSFKVLGINRDVRVQIASTRDDWDQAFRLVADNYRARGYEAGRAAAYRFTAHHALPDTVVLVAKEQGQVVATLSMFMDNTLLGLPMESVYGEELKALRRAGRRLAEVGSLADGGLTTREFLAVFLALIKLTWQHFLRQGGDTAIIAVNPRHRYFYTKAMGFTPMGGQRAYPTVQNHPAEAYLLDVPMLRERAPEMYQQIFGQPLPPETLRATRMPNEWARDFGGHSTQTEATLVEDILRYVTNWGSPRRW